MQVRRTTAPVAYLGDLDGDGEYEIVMNAANGAVETQARE